MSVSVSTAAVHAVTDWESDADERTKQDVNRRRQPERVPVQRWVTVVPTFRVVRVPAQSRIGPVISCTHVTRASEMVVPSN